MRAAWSRGGEVIASVDLKARTNRVMLDYQRKVDGEWQARRYPVEIAWTACH